MIGIRRFAGRLLDPLMMRACRHRAFRGLAKGARLLLSGRFAELAARVGAELRRRGGPWRSLPAIEDRYRVWLGFNAWTPADERRLRERLESAVGPLPPMSVVMPVYNPEAGFLERAVRSVQAQVYDSWELCIADDGSTVPGTGELLDRLSRDDARLRVTRLAANTGFSGATNAAAALAGGEFLVFLDHDDELAPDALAEVALYAAAHPGTDFVYSDEDKIDLAGNRYDPQFKPDSSPELLLSYMYMGHLGAIRRSLYAELGGLRTEFDGSQDHDLVLRVTERTAGVGHIPGERIATVPKTPDVGRYYRAADLMVCTSRIESYPLVILEAMAHGLPIVTTPVFGIAEQVREGVNAFFYRPGDAAELASRLARLLADDALRGRMARSSPEVLAALTSYDEMLDRWAEVIREAASTSGRKTGSAAAGV